MIRPEEMVLRKGEYGFRVRIDGRAKDAGGVISSPQKTCALRCVLPFLSASSELNMLATRSESFFHRSSDF